VTPWLAFFAPAGTPAAVVSRLRAETDKLLNDADMRQKIRSLGGLEPYITTPDEFAALLRADYAKYGEIVKAVGVRID
jgi:tripartite-type tricarboxylate transporter receptor subunit TctC